MRTDVGQVLLDGLKRMLTEAEFSFDNPDPMLAWEVFKTFAREPLSLNDDRISFRAGREGLPPRYKFGLAFRRAFWPEGKGGRVRDFLALAFECDMPRRFTLKKVPVILRVSDFASLDDFFEAVEHSYDFRLVATLSPWACELYLNSERW